MRKLFVIYLLLTLGSSHAYEATRTIPELLAQTDVVVVGNLTEVSERISEGVSRGEGTIEISEVLLGARPDSTKITLRWSNRLYRSGALEFKDTGDTKFVWLLWRAQDGSYGARHSSCQVPLDLKHQIAEAIETKKQNKAEMATPRKPSD